MKINFTYNKKTDRECWYRYKNFIKQNGTVWGLTKNIKPVIYIKKINLEIDVTDIIEAYKKIFSFDVKIKGYIVTTPFSMINDDKKISKKGVIFYSIYTSNTSVVMAHEIFHIFFEKYTQRKITNYDEAKEYFTIILNDIFGVKISKGYPKHQKIRRKIFQVWKRTKSIDQCLATLKPL